MLLVCKESRAIAEQYYTRFRSCYRRVDRARYHNTILDSFYIGCKSVVSSDYKILIDIMIMQNTPRNQCKELLEDLKNFANIGHLVVKLEIFGTLPA